MSKIGEVVVNASDYNDRLIETIDQVISRLIAQKEEITEVVIIKKMKSGGYRLDYMIPDQAKTNLLIDTAKLINLGLLDDE